MKPANRKSAASSEDSNELEEHEVEPSRIGPEQLSAFADGRLKGRARAEMIARLAKDQDARELLADVMAVRGEIEASSDDAEADAEDEAEARTDEAKGPAAAPGGRLLRGPWQRRTWAAVAALAAALALLVVAPRLVIPPTPSLELVTDGLESAELEAVERGIWPAMRGGSPGDALDGGFGSRVSFRWAVRAVDFQLALRSADTDFVASTAHAVDRIVSGTPIEGQYPGLAAEETRLALRGSADLAELAISSGIVEPFFFRYGLWTRAAWLAAESGDAEYFRSAAGRSIHGLEAPPGAEDELVEEIETLRRLSSSVASGDGDLDVLERELWRILTTRSR